MARRPLPRIQPARALVAAVKRIDPNDETAARSVRRRDNWQSEAWTYFDEIGEAKHAARYLARSLSRLILQPGWLNDERRPGPITDSVIDDAALDDAWVAAARDALDRIDAGAMGGWSSLLNRWGVTGFVAGEAWLIGYVDNDTGTEVWGVYSQDEVDADVTTNGTKWYLRLDGPNTPLSDLTPLTDPVILRIWTPHGRWFNRPDSPMRGVLDVCDELVTLTRTVRAANLSRLASKVVFLPNTMTGGDGSITYDENGDPVDNDDGGSEFVRDLHQHFITPISDPSDPESVAPFVVEADPDDIAAVRVEDLSRPLTEVRADREDLIARFAQGIDLPVEVVKGKAESNHWTAWQVTEDEYRVYIEPPAAEFVQSIVAGYFRPALAAAGVPPEVVERFTIYVDAYELVRRPDRSEVTFEAHDRFLISDEYARAELGAPDDAAPTPEEVAARVERGGARPGAPAATPSPTGPPDLVRPTPASAAPLAAALSDLANVPEVAVRLDEPVTAAGRRRRPLGEALAALDAALLDRLTTMLDAAMRRAIERAGARIRSKAGKTPAADAVRTVDNASVAATLGPAVVAALDVDTESLFDGAFDDVLARVEAAIAATQSAAARELAARIADAEPDDEELATAQDENRHAAVVALGATLTALAVQQVFNPNPTVTTGEVPASPLTVPPSVAREAMARAGGSSVTGPGGAGVDVTGSPVGGVATGADVTDRLVTFGVQRSGYVWVYGDPGARQTPFDPHLELDGVEFSSWDDDVLTNDFDWPPEPFFYPGDHLWCQCSFAPAFTDESGDL